MRCTAWILALWMAAASTATSARGDTFLPRALAPEEGLAVLDRSAAERLVGRALLDEPAACAVYGEVHLYDRLPYVEAHYVHVTSDAHWQRLLYGAPGDAPRAFGRAGSGPGEFGEPRGLAFAPDGRLFVADPGLGRVTVLRLRQTPDGPSLEYASQIDGLVQPMDVLSSSCVATRPCASPSSEGAARRRASSSFRAPSASLRRRSRAAPGCT